MAVGLVALGGGEWPDCNHDTSNEASWKPLGPAPLRTSQSDAWLGSQQHDPKHETIDRTMTMLVDMLLLFNAVWALIKCCVVLQIAHVPSCISDVDVSHAPVRIFTKLCIHALHLPCRSEFV